MHDLIAEFNGYRNELAAAEQYDNTKKAAAVRKEITRVAKGINARIDQLMQESDEADAELQDLTAAQKRQEARRMARELPEKQRGDRARELTADNRPGSQDAADHTPTETATPPGEDRSAGRGRQSSPQQSD